MSNVADIDDRHAHVVYRCYDSNGALLYVGCTRDLDYRLTLHNPLVVRNLDRVDVEHFANRVDARAAERAAISAESPLLNKQHNPTRFRKCGAGFVAVEPIHPLTQALVDQDRPVTMDAKREAMERVGALLYGGAA